MKDNCSDVYMLQHCLSLLAHKRKEIEKFVISLKAAGVKKSTFQVNKRKSGFLLVMFHSGFCVYNMLVNK